MKNKKAFTLIELVAVLVILAILALIVTPLVLNIIRKARTAADKRSIDAYGRSIELAIADYLLDKGEFPTSIDQLTIEHTGDKVVCDHATLNEDSSIYLAECTVAGRSVAGYTYGSEEPAPTYTAYSVGDEVTYNNVDYYVIANSGTNESSVTLLKATPITSSEINPYLSSIEVGSKVDTSGMYAKMAYYSAENCVSAGDISGCSTDYEVSDIKQVVDIWKTNYASETIAARLITIDDLTTNLGYEYFDNGSEAIYQHTDSTPSWVYSNNYSFWTMSQFNDLVSDVWYMRDSNFRGTIIGAKNEVRPVITLLKSALN